MNEYDLDFKTSFKCGRKNLSNVQEIKDLGSSITAIELCMMIEDRLEKLKLKDERVKKISYNFNRENDYIYFSIHLMSIKRLNKETLSELKDNFFKTIEKEFSENRIHVFENKNKDLKDVYLKIIY